MTGLFARVPLPIPREPQRSTLYTNWRPIVRTKRHNASDCCNRQRQPLALSNAEIYRREKEQNARRLAGKVSQWTWLSIVARRLIRRGKYELRVLSKVPSHLFFLNNFINFINFKLNINLNAEMKK